MKTLLRFTLALLLATLAWTPASVLAQSSRGAVTGVIQDASGAVLPGATVTLTSPATGVTRTATANSAGIYRFESVTPDEYMVAASATGFAKSQAPATVTVGSLVGRDFKLGVSGGGTTVEVSADHSVELQTEDAVRGGTISFDQLQELPIPGQNPLNLLLTLPGVSRSNTGGANDNGVGSVNGARGRSNNFLIDGLQNNDISVTGTQFAIYNDDELQEVNFQTSNFTAEYGRAGGAVVTEVTKSGTNNIHGTVAEVYHSEIFDATSQSQRIAAGFATTNVKPKFKENIPAFTIGGPVWIPHLYDGRNRTFVFGAGQWDRYSSGASQSTPFIIPTANGYATLSALASSCPNVAKYLSQVGDQRGTTNISTIDISVPAGLANTTCNGTARTGQLVEIGSFVRSVQTVTLDNNHLIRFDHNPSSRQNMVFRWIYDYTSAVPGIIGINPNFDVNTYDRFMGGFFSDAYSITPTLVNEFRFGYTRSALNFPLTGPALTVPAFGITSLTSLAASASYPQGRTANNFQYQDTLTYVRGRHAWKFGAEFLRQLAAQISPFDNRGTYTFIQNPINAANGVTSVISSLSNFIDNDAGPGGGFTIQIGNPRYHPNLFTQSYYIQDTFKFSPDLTLTYGVRYENFGQPANIFKYPAFAGTADTDVTNPARVATDSNNFGPSVGFSYNPHVFSHGILSGNTVIRGGYQVSYDTFYNNLLSNLNAAVPNTLSNAPITSVASQNTPRGYMSLVGASAAAAAITPFSSVSNQYSQNIRNPYYHHYSLGFQQQFPSQVVLDVAYVGSQGRQGIYSNYVNPIMYDPVAQTYATESTAYGTQYKRFYANRGQIIIRQTGANSNYNGLQIQLRRRNMQTRFGNFSFTEAYTYSKLLGVIDDPFSTYGSFTYSSRPQVLAGPIGNFDYGPSDLDLKHVSTTTILWKLPEPSGHLLKALVGGWSVSPILYLQSGQPYTVLNGLDRDFDGASSADRPNIGNRNAPLNTRAVVTSTANCASGYWDPGKATTSGVPSTGCVLPSDSHFVQVATYSTTGNIEGRNENYTTRYLDLDTDVLKKFAITERFKAELRGEFFNVTNNQNYNTPSASLNVNSNNGKNFQNFVAVATARNGTGRTFRVGAKVLF